MIYGYARVSTAGQATDGNSLQFQEKELRENGAEKIYFDTFTGTKLDRPEFNKLIAKLKDGDTLIVSKLDRIARSAGHAIILVDELLEKGVTINVLNMGTLNNSPIGSLMRTMLFGFAQFERDMIVQRTQEGKRIARQRPDFKEGRPRKEHPELPEMYAEVQKGTITVKEACERMNISRASYYRLVKEIA